MFDSLFYWTGVVTWFVICYILLLVIPVVVVLLLARGMKSVSLIIDNRYYDDIYDVREARDGQKWYYYVGHFSVSARYRLMDFAKWYASKWEYPVKLLTRLWSNLF